jgi:hypothetical protein
VLLLTEPVVAVGRVQLTQIELAAALPLVPLI